MENRQAPSGRKNSSHAVSLALRAGPVLLLVFFVDLDAQRLEKLQILIADLEFGVGAEGGDQGSLVGGVFALLADADGGFEDEENVVAAFLDAGHDSAKRSTSLCPILNRTETR